MLTYTNIQIEQTNLGYKGYLQPISYRLLRFLLVLAYQE